ncbi:MAG: fibronectin type III domain-containing protein [Flavobacteriales bacterium]|nr:MAG: fibronectin type III domain-containing protein [Flavobacteriales bacterium]
MKKIWYEVKLGHTRVTYAALVEMSGTNITMLTNNASFPAPNPSLADFEKAKDRLVAAVDAYRFTRSRLDKEERDIAFAELKTMRADLGAYVQTTSAGDKELITSAGFQTEKARQPVGLLPAPSDVRAIVRPFPGSLELRFKGVKGRLSYQVSMCAGDPNVEANWNIVATTGKNRMVFDDLESNAVYFFRVVALGAAGWSPVSDVAAAKAA